MKVTKFTAGDGTKEIIVTEPQRQALEHAGYLARGGYVSTELEGAPTHSDWEVSNMLGEYGGMTLIEAVDESELLFDVVDPLKPDTEQRCGTFALALSCAKHRFGCNVVVMQAKDTRGREHELRRLAVAAGVALLIVPGFEQQGR